MVYQYDGNDVGVFTPGIFVALSTNMLQLFIKRQLFSDQGWPAYVPLIGWPAYVPPNCSMRRTRRRLLMTGFSSVQLLSHVWLFATPWTPACQASLSITNSPSLLKLMPIELVVPSNHLILCCPLLSCPQSFPASGSFTMSQFFISGGQSVEVSASASVLPMSKCLLTSWLQSPSAVVLEPPRKSLSLFPLFPHLFAIKWWDQIPWS